MENEYQPTTALPEQQPKKAARLKRWQRAALTMSAALLTTACGGISLPGGFNESTPTSSSTESVTKKQTVFPFAEKMAQLQQDFPDANKHATFSASEITSQFSTADYQRIRITNKNNKDYEDVSASAVPFIEITYDVQKNSIQVHDKTPNGISDSFLAEILSPVEQNSTLLHAAFEENKLNKVVFFQDNPSILQDNYNPKGFHFNTETADPSNHKSVYITIPGSTQVDKNAITLVKRHETIHSLTSSNPLSEISENTTALNEEELGQWPEICSDIRKIAIQDAREYQEDIIENLENMSNAFDNPIIQDSISVIRRAMNNGTFDNFQPKQGEDTQTMAFTAIVPNCRTIGPWEAMVRHLEAKGHSELVEEIVKSKNVTFVDTLHDDWQNIMANNTIYTIFREGGYTSVAEDTRLGHPWDNFDEGRTAAINTALSYPEPLKNNINRLEEQKKKTATKFILYTLDTFAKDIDPKQTNLLGLIAERRAVFA